MLIYVDAALDTSAVDRSIDVRADRLRASASQPRDLANDSIAEDEGAR
jgi:hypothetical protein